MIIQKFQTEDKEPTIQLKDSKPGVDIIRFANDSFEEAIKSDLFFIRIDDPNIKDGRVKIVNLKDGKELIRDGDHKIVIHKGILNILV